MTETMLRTSAEKSTLRQKTLHPKAINKTKTVFCRIKFLPRHCKVEIHTPTKQTFKQFDMHAEFNTFLDQKSLACKFFISTIQTLNLSLHCTYLKLNCSMEVNKGKQHRWHVSNETNSYAILRDTYVACGYVLWVVPGIARPVETMITFLAAFMLYMG